MSPESASQHRLSQDSSVIAPPAVGDTPTKMTSSLPASNDSPGGAHEHRLYLDVSASPPSPENATPAFDLVGHLAKIAEEGQETDKTEDLSKTPKEGRKTPKQNSSKKNKEQKETPKSADGGSKGRRKSGRRSVPPSDVETNEKNAENEVIKPKSAPAAYDHANVSKDAGKRRRSARLSSVPNLAPVDENETPKGRSRRMSKVPNVPPLSEETTSVLDTVERESSDSDRPTSRASSVVSKESSIPEEDSPSLQDRLKAKIAPKRTSRRSSLILANDQQNQDQDKSKKEMTKNDRPKTPTNKSYKADVPTKKGPTVKTPTSTSRPASSKDVSDRARDLTPINEKRKSPRRKSDYSTQKKSQINATARDKSKDRNNNPSFKQPAVRPLIGTKKVRQSIEEFSKRSYNISTSKKINSQSSPLNIRKRNLMSRDMSSSAVASQLESTAAKSGRPKKGYPPNTSRNNKTNSAISQGRLEPTQSIQSLVMTSLHYDEQDVVESVVKKLGRFRMRDTVCSHTTHVICGKNRRTLNVLHAIAQGCWLLSYEWILKSLENGQWVEEAPYEVDYFPAAKRSRLLREENGLNCDIFGSCGSIFVSEKSTPPKSHIVKLVAKCSGQVTSDSEDADIAVGKIHHYHRANVTEQWVLDSVSSLECAQVKDYQISHRSMARSQSPQF